MTLYRDNVGIMLTNGAGQVLVGEMRRYPGEWIMPQGGVIQGEVPEHAVYRELYEETGIQKHLTTLLAVHPEWVPYRFRKPMELDGVIYAGQKQKWFLLEYLDVLPDANEIADEEFTDFKWATPDWVLQRVADYKADVYRSAFDTFADYLR